MITRTRRTGAAVTRVMTLAVLALVTPAVVTAPASAGGTGSSGGSGVVRSGSCSSSAHWKLKAKPDDGRIEVEAEVDSNNVGQTWHWRIRHNGDVSATGTATTTGPSGSFEVRRRMADLWHEDGFTFRAVNHASGEACRGMVRL